MKYFTLLVESEIKDKISCGLKQGFYNSSSTNDENTLRTTTGRRRKRSASNEEPKYGCPEGFRRASQYMCLTYFVNMEGFGIRTSLNDSEEYCQTREGNARLLYIENNDEALTIWNQLGIDK